MGARDRQARAFILTLDKDLAHVCEVPRNIFLPTENLKLPATRVVGHKIKTRPLQKARVAT